MKHTAPQELSLSELIELSKLKTKLFQGEMFVEFTPEVLESDTFKRYDELIKKKQKFLAYYDKLKTCN
jgi:hypothetical protein